MARRLLRQKLDSAGTSATLLLLALMTAIPPMLAAGPARWIALLLIAGALVSRDASNGSLQMILARPISRTDYLLGRFAGALAAYAGFLLFASVTGLALARAFGGNTPDLRGLAGELAAALLDGALVVAVLLFLSTFLPGYGDVVAYFATSVAISAVLSLAQNSGRRTLASAARAAQGNLFPAVPWDAFMDVRRIPLEAVGRWALALVGYFVLAAVVFSRREFAYGHD
jgi:ABC-type transport system involved in multi-copper enzyme maturation permease subunit